MCFVEQQGFALIIHTRYRPIWKINISALFLIKVYRHSIKNIQDFERIEDDPDDAFDAKLNQIKRRRLEESHKSENVIMQAIGRLEASRENLEPCDVTENILSFPPLLRKPALTSACLPVCGVDATKLYESMHNLPRCLDGFVQGGFLSDVFFLRMSFDDSEKEEWQSKKFETMIKCYLNRLVVLRKVWKEIFSRC